MRLANATDPIARQLAALDGDPSPAAYLHVAHEIAGAASASLRTLRVSLLASFTVDPVAPYLTVELARRGLRLQPQIAPFNSVVTELIDASSATHRHEPDAVIVAQLLDDVAPPLARDFPGLAAGEVAALSQRVVDDLRGAVGSFRARSSASVFVLGFVPPPLTGVALGGRVIADEQAHAVRALNSRLSESLRQVAGAHLIDLEDVVAEVGSRRWWNPNAWYLARAPLAAPMLPVLARRLAAVLAASVRPPRKCLVVDLDDTLWGGVVGEVGPSGIEVGADYPGSVFRDLQRALLGLRRRGVLLAINSKNNLADVTRAFAQHPHMVLRLDDFAAIRANWANKPDNMREIADELNIGLDSLVFLDDNPSEREHMRQALPQVLTLDLPPHPIRFVEALESCEAFSRAMVVDEDLKRTEMYAAQGERRQLEGRSVTVEAFLESLEMHVTVEPASRSSRDRIVDLLGKTNQFNVTTRRYAAAEVAGMMADSNVAVLTARVRDRYGDNGLVGVAIARLTGTTALVDTLLLSCRVIGRRIETVLLAELTAWAARRGAQSLVGEFVPTERNAPAADCFARHGFVGDDCDGRPVWRLDLDAGAVTVPSYISVTSEVHG